MAKVDKCDLAISLFRYLLRQYSCNRIVGGLNEFEDCM
jgi:hypothetical protein